MTYRSSVGHFCRKLARKTRDFKNTDIVKHIVFKRSKLNLQRFADPFGVSKSTSTSRLRHQPAAKRAATSYLPPGFRLQASGFRFQARRFNVGGSSRGDAGAWRVWGRRVTLETRWEHAGNTPRTRWEHAGNTLGMGKMELTLESGDFRASNTS